jgi:ABC-type nitrate/sulfonate/bicarbonate transport system substrate-binding protein
MYSKSAIEVSLEYLVKEVSEEHGRRSAFLRPTKSAEGASVLKHHTQQISRFTLIAIVLVVVLTMLFSLFSCSKGDYSGKIETFTIGQNPNETKALIYIAEERGLFATNSLNVVFRDYNTGMEVADVILNGEIDLATCAEYVIVRNVLKKKNICNIASISKCQNTYIIGRTDKGIRGAVDDKK